MLLKHVPDGPGGSLSRSESMADDSSGNDSSASSNSPGSVDTSGVLEDVSDRSEDMSRASN